VAVGFNCLGLPILVVHTEPILYIVKLPILRLTQICECYILDCKRDLEHHISSTADDKDMKVKASWRALIGLHGFLNCQPRNENERNVDGNKSLSLSRTHPSPFRLLLTLKLVLCVR